MRKLLSTIGVILFFGGLVYGQGVTKVPPRLKGLVEKLAKVNRVETEYVGMGGKGKAYPLFQELKKKATLEDWLKLTDHDSAAVACYAGIALIDLDYKDLKGIFNKFIHRHKSVKTMSGCLGFTEPLATCFYSHCCGRIASASRKDDPRVMQLDSMILYYRNPDWFLLTLALDNRFYQEPYKSQIAVQAFEWQNVTAFWYLCKWYKGEYADQIKTALLKYLQQSDWANLDGISYYTTVKELFEFDNDPQIKKAIMDKIKVDTSWKSDQKFDELLRSQLMFNYNFDSEEQF